MIRHTPGSQSSLPGFELPFGGHLDGNNRWVKLAEVIPWEELVEAYCGVMSARRGRPAKSPRLVIGALIIKHKLNLSDEETVRQIQENPYLQYFCGFSGFTPKQPFAPSLFVEIRKRMGSEVFDRFEEALRERLAQVQGAGRRHKPKKDAEGGGDRSADDSTVSADSGDIDDAGNATGESGEDCGETASDEGKEESASQGKLILDATVAEQTIRYPTDLGILNEAREVSERLIDLLYPMSGLSRKPRTYRKVARKEYLAVARMRKPRQKTVRRGIRKQLQYLRRNLRHIDALLDRYSPTIEARLGGKVPVCRGSWPSCFTWRHQRQLWVIREVYRQQKEMYDKKLKSFPHRIVSISQPHVRPMVRGKAGKPVEFGSKLSVSLDGRGLARVDRLCWEPFNEGGDLKEQVEAYRQRYGHYPAVVLADRIYCTRENRRYCRERDIRLGCKPLGRPRKVTEANRRELREEQKARRRAELERVAIEGKFGQGKNGYGLNRIRAKLAGTSEAWIRGVFLVMNLLVLLKLFFAFVLRGVSRVFADCLSWMFLQTRTAGFPGGFQPCDAGVSSS